MYDEGAWIWDGIANMNFLEVAFTFMFQVGVSRAQNGKRINRCIQREVLHYKVTVIETLY